MLFESIESLIKTFSPQKRYCLSDGDRTLSELAGYSAADRLLIINLDDIGLCPSTNATVDYLYQAGKQNSLSVIVGAAGFEEAVAILKKHNRAAGVHLTLTTEWESHIIKPILPTARIPSLLNPQNSFFNDINALYLQADNTEVEAECRAQIEKALGSGIRLDHLDTHMGVMQLRPDFVEIYLRLAGNYNLPLRMGSENLARLMSVPIVHLQEARNQKIIFPDNLIYIPMSFTSAKSVRFEAYDFAIRNILTGVSEIYFHPSQNGEDYRALKHAYSARKALDYESIRLWDFEYLRSGRMEQIVRDESIKLIDYAALARIQAQIKTA